MLGTESSLVEVGGEQLDGGLGMTTERQENVRNALFSMLGDTSSHQRLNDQSSPRELTTRSKPLNASVNPTEWSCSACTLLNPAGGFICSACGCANYKI